MIWIIAVLVTLWILLTAARVWLWWRERGEWVGVSDATDFSPGMVAYVAGARVRVVATSPQRLKVRWL